MNHYMHLYGSTVINVNRIRSMVNLTLEARVRYWLYIVIYCKQMHYTTDSLVWGSLRLTLINDCIHNMIFAVPGLQISYYFELWLISYKCLASFSGQGKLHRNKIKHTVQCFVYHQLPSEFTAGITAHESSTNKCLAH